MKISKDLVIEISIIVLILIVSSYWHIEMIYCGKHSRIFIILIMISFLVLLLMFGEHFVYYYENYKIENYTWDELKNNYDNKYLNTNQAIQLLTKLSTHPMFTIM